MIWRLALSALVMALVGALLSEMGFHSKRIFSALCITLLFLAVLDGVGEIFPFVSDFAEVAGVEKEARCAVKVVGVSYVFGFVSDACDELGEKGISSGVSYAGRIEIFLLIFPYIKEIINAGIGLLK